MNCDLIIKNGHLLDTCSGLDRVADLAVCGGKITAIGASDCEARTVVDAAGCYVTPGLIDYHCHVNYGGDSAGVPADLYAFANGVTTVVDGGSMGSRNYGQFHDSVAVRALSDVRAFLFIGSMGQFISDCVSDQAPENIAREELLRTCSEYAGEIIGLKTKISTEFTGAAGIEVLRNTVELGEAAGLRISAHATNPCDSYENILSILRPGDIFCHLYHNKGETILTPEGSVKDCFRAARERGVLFDAAHGRTTNFSLEVAGKAIRDGFYPDIISSDYTNISHKDRYSFCTMLSEYLNMGMSFPEVIRRCTEIPYGLIHGVREPQLDVGKRADIAVFRLVDDHRDFQDHFGFRIPGNTRIVPEMTVRKGAIVFDRLP